MTYDPHSLTERIKRQAAGLGFELVGVAEVRASEHADFLREWLRHGHHGEMDYLARTDAVERRADPRSAWPNIRSAIVLGRNYRGAGVGAGADVGGVARYAEGRDYHKVIKAKLLDMLRWLETEIGRELPAARAYVDTGPLLERELARRAGLGWFGRNTMLVNPKHGSFFFLASLLVEIELEYDAPFDKDHCGTCSACVSACPTGALLGRDANGAPVIDARRCISYLTIEQRGPIPRELRPLIGNRIFGCDICQDVCPWNGPKFVQVTREPAGNQSSGGESERRRLTELVTMDEAAWDKFSRGTAFRRAKRSGFLRNVAVALGNWGSPEAVPALTRALDDPDPLVRGHAAWALGRIGSAGAREALIGRLNDESVASVREEVERALAEPEIEV